MGAVNASATWVVSMLASEPDAVRTPDPDIVSPGFAGFLAVFAIACATVLIIRLMTRSMRRAKFTADELARQEKADSAPEVPEAPRQG